MNVMNEDVKHFVTQQYVKEDVEGDLNTNQCQVPNYCNACTDPRERQAFRLLRLLVLVSCPL